MGLEESVDSFFFVPTDVSPVVVLVLSGWLFYRRRQRLFSLPRQSAHPLLVAAFLIPGGLVFAWAILSRVSDLLALSLIFNLFGFALLLGGTPAARAIVVPTACLLFILPLPAPLLNEIVYRFQIWSAEYAGWILYQIGVPGFVSGDQILQHGKRFVVIESCSGLRSVETLTMLALLLVDLFHRRGAHAAILLVSAPFVAFALNGLRVVGLILNPHSRVAAIHTLQGVAILLAGLVILYLLDGLLAKLKLAGPSPSSPAPPLERAGPLPVYLITAVLAVTSLGPIWLPSWAPQPTATMLLTMQQVEDRLDDWVSAALDQSQLRFFFGTVGLRQSLLRRYRLGAGKDNNVELFVGFGMHSNRYRSPISPKTALPGSGWAVEAEERRVLEPDQREVVARVLRSGVRHVLAYHWYEGADSLPRETIRNFLALDRTPWHRDRDALTVRMSTDLGGPNPEDRVQGDERLAQFYLALREALSPEGEALQ